MTERPLNWNSRTITHGWQRGTNAFFYGLGLTDAQLSSAQIGIGVPLLDGNLCNMHAYALGQSVAEGCREVGMLGFPFGVPGISDNITQGHEGGGASLPSRNMIADAAEAVVSGHAYDGLIGLHHCDKNGPGFAMALARMNVPGLLLSGGTIRPGCLDGRDISILDVYDAEAKAQIGTMTRAEADRVLRAACPGAGGCGIAASFNTWGLAMEAIGLMAPGSASLPADDPAKTDDARRSGAMMRHLLELDLRPRDILTLTAFENATRMIGAAGGSTNGILHLLALAREVGVPFGLAEIGAILRDTPVLCAFAPRGRKTMVDLHKLGGTPVLIRFLHERGLLDGSPVTVTGKTLAENLRDVPGLPEGQELIAVEKPYKPLADMQIAFGNLAPQGMVFKVSSLTNPVFQGRAICFDDPRQVAEAAQAKRIQPGDVIVLRYLGPVAAGMPEVLVASSALSTPELDGKVAMISDTRVSGVSHGIIGVHCTPEAAWAGRSRWSKTVTRSRSISMPGWWNCTSMRNA